MAAPPGASRARRACGRRGRVAGDRPELGAGPAFPAMMTLAMSGATASDSGLASGLANATQQVGAALGLAALATLATSRRRRAAGRGPRARTRPRH